MANRMEILNINQEMCYYISSLRENNLRFEWDVLQNYNEKVEFLRNKINSVL